MASTRPKNRQDSKGDKTQNCRFLRRQSSTRLLTKLTRLKAADSFDGLDKTQNRPKKQTWLTDKIPKVTRLKAADSFADKARRDSWQKGRQDSQTKFKSRFLLQHSKTKHSKSTRHKAKADSRHHWQDSKVKADSKADKTQTDSPKKIPRTTRLKAGPSKRLKSRFQGQQDSKLARRQDSKIKQKQIPKLTWLKAEAKQTRQDSRRDTKQPTHHSRRLDAFL